MTDPSLIFNYSEIHGTGTETCPRFCDALRVHGYAVIEINASEHGTLFSAKELGALAEWEGVLQDTFSNLNKQEKRLMGKYRSEKGVAVGYRDDDKREFIETHLKEGVSISSAQCVKRVVGLTPPLRKLPSTVANKSAEALYTRTVVHLGYACRKVGFQVLRQVSASFPELEGEGPGGAVDADFFTKLTDLTVSGRRPLSAGARAVGLCDEEADADAALEELLCCVADPEDVDEEEAAVEDIEYSSSVLRLCNYPDESTLLGAMDASEVPAPVTPRAYGFGAHTDTSFFTLGCCNRTAPGLEILDRSDMQWKSVERDLAQLPCAGAPGVTHIAVFVGEFLQVLSGHAYMAVVHRVLAPGPVEPKAEVVVSSDGTGEREGEGSQYRPRSRVSCPMIVRGKNKAVVGLRGPGLGGDREVVGDTMPPRPPPAPSEGSSSSSSLLPPRLALSYSSMNMKLIHLLLDKKRAKCMHAHNDSEQEEVRQDTDWVLSAFPEMHMRSLDH